MTAYIGVRVILRAPNVHREKPREIVPPVVGTFMDSVRFNIYFEWSRKVNLYLSVIRRIYNVTWARVRTASDRRTGPRISRGF